MVINLIKTLEQIPEPREGEECFLYKGKPIPKQFAWFVVLTELLKKGYKLRVHYSDNDIRDKPSKFSMDRENGIAPVMPLRVEVFREEVEYVDDDLSRVFGQKVIVKKEKVLDLENLIGLDPDPETSLNLIGMVV